MYAAFLAVRRNRGAAGIDRVSVEMFEANLPENLRALERDLKDGSFVPFPLRRKYIPRRMRPKSVRKFQDKVREITRRSLNLEASVIEELNPVIRGTAQYFATRWFTGRDSLRKLDCWNRELTPSRQRGGGGRKATPLPTLG